MKLVANGLIKAERYNGYHSSNVIKFCCCRAHKRHISVSVFLFIEPFNDLSRESNGTSCKAVRIVRQITINELIDAAQASAPVPLTACGALKCRRESVREKCSRQTLGSRPWSLKLSFNTSLLDYNSEMRGRAESALQICQWQKHLNISWNELKSKPI